MYLHDAQAAVERIFNRNMMRPYGVDVQYARGCRRTYIVTINDLRGNEVKFTLPLAQLLDSDRVQAKLITAFVRLEKMGTL